jgi:F-type H+-transporting ATPase subunit delta
MVDITHVQTIDGYASGLLSVAGAEGDVDGVTDELYRIAGAFAGSAELRDTLSDPKVPLERKLGIVSDLLGSRASRTTVSLVEMLVSMGRIREFGEIVARAMEMSAAAEEQVVAEVTSAIPLDESTLDRLAQKLAAATGRKVAVRAVVDPALIGGVIAKVGDTVFDGSVRSRLEDLREVWG